MIDDYIIVDGKILITIEMIVDYPFYQLFCNFPLHNFGKSMIFFIIKDVRVSLCTSRLIPQDLEVSSQVNFQ